MRISTAAIVLLTIGLPAAAANAQTSGDEIAELKQMIIEMRDDYERRISELEARLDGAEREARVAKRDAGEAFELAEETAIQQSPGSSSPNTFNPSIGAVLDGGFADVGGGWEEIPGFQPAGEIGTGETGFSPGELEINLNSNIDTRFFGNVTFALASEDGEVEVEFEEAWVQTTARPAISTTSTSMPTTSSTGRCPTRHFTAAVIPSTASRHAGLHPPRCCSRSERKPTGAAASRPPPTPRPRRALIPCLPGSAATSATATAGSSACHTSAPMPSTAPAATRAKRKAVCSPATAT